MFNRHFCYPFFPPLPAAVQVDFGDRDGLDDFFVALLVDEVDILSIFDRVAVNGCHGGVAARPGPDLHRLVFPRRPVRIRPAESHVYPWRSDTTNQTMFT